ncbi:MAG TPA: protein kinase, partial [Vicinamibacterales bacterium]
VGLREDFVKVLDFGLVTSVAGATDDRSLATAVGQIHGTPAYMAPELATGQTADARSDLYALGCVAYFMLTGRLVFEGGTPVQTLARRLSEEPVPPSERTELVIPAELERVVLACIARRSEDRPQSATELGRALAAVPVTPWTEEQARDWWRSNRPSGQPAVIPAEAETRAADLTTR